MYSLSSQSETGRPFLTWQSILDWGQQHYRIRTFAKDEKIPTRPGLLYLVQRGAVRLVSSESQVNTGGKSLASRVRQASSEENFLGFVGAGQPFEIVTSSPFSLESVAHVDQTVVLWMYWNELDNWPHFRREVLEAFRYQNQRHLLWLSALGQRRTIDRLLGLLTMLIQEYGEPCDQGYYLPWTLTHAQIGSAIGATRVTVTRLMGKLRQRGVIITYSDHLLCLPSETVSKAV